MKIIKKAAIGPGNINFHIFIVEDEVFRFSRKGLG